MRAAESSLYLCDLFFEILDILPDVFGKLFQALKLCRNLPLEASELQLDLLRQCLNLTDELFLGSFQGRWRSFLLWLRQAHGLRQRICSFSLHVQLFFFPPCNWGRLLLR